MLAYLSPESKSKRKRFLKSVDRIQTGKLVLSTSMARGMGISLKLASDYLSTKKTFAPGTTDTPLDSYNNVRSYLSSSLAKTLVCKALFEETMSSEQTNNSFAILKIVNTQLAQQVLFETREKMGLHGLFTNNKVITFLNQLPGVVTAEGDNEIILIRLGKDLLTSKLDLKSESKRLFKYVCQGKISEARLLGRYLKNRALLSLKLAFETKVQKKDLFTVWNQNIESVIQLALIHSYIQSYRALELFLQKNPGIDTNLKSAMLKIYQLEVIKHLNQKGISLKFSNHNRQHYIENIFKNRDSIFEILKIPTCLIRSPLYGNFEANYINEFKSDSRYENKVL